MTPRIAPLSDHQQAETICTCYWCGFKGMKDFRLYVEAGDTIASCDICFYVRHLFASQSVAPLQYEIIWAPEVPQVALSHLVRTIAFARMTSSQPHLARVEKSAAEIMKELRQRKTALEGILKASGKASLSEILFGDLLDTGDNNSFDKVTEDWKEGPHGRLVNGLRILRTRFDRADIRDWQMEGASFASFNNQVVESERWFLQTIDPTLAQSLEPEFKSGS